MWDCLFVCGLKKGRKEAANERRFWLCFEINVNNNYPCKNLFQE